MSLTMISVEIEADADALLMRVPKREDDNWAKSERVSPSREEKRPIKHEGTHDSDDAKFSPSADIDDLPYAQERKRVSKSGTPPTPARANGAVKVGPQLVDHLPCADEEARRTFEELRANMYQYGTLGRSREALESMTCDCQFVPGEYEPWMACGDGSDCINRLTQVECLEDDCRCRGYCQNQRMQRRQNADIEIVLTEKKGYGLRASSDIRKDAFIYEYIGEVVSQHSLAKRMRDYAEQGIKHFYFMMLQKDEFIDATKRGGIGRFANHSCNPNCFVAKWTVGDRVRMGVYAKRNIIKGEELTFNYNVDRYGHEAQPCYCGEQNCIGLLGGKTQTDVAAMDDLYLDALGISDEVEMYGLKGNKKRKSKKLDEDYVPELKPLQEKDVPKVVQAIRQTQSRKVLLKLLMRIKLTEDHAPLRQLMRLRGFSLMCNILQDYGDDFEINMIVLECMTTWPLLQRNKVEDSQIEVPVKTLVQSENESLAKFAQKLLDHWSTLEVGYRIPKRVKQDGDDEAPSVPLIFEEQASRDDDYPHKYKRSRLVEIEHVDISHIQHLKPLGRSAMAPTIAAQISSEIQTTIRDEEPSKKRGPSRQDIDSVIAAAASRAAEEAQRIAEAAAAAAEAEAKRRERHARIERAKKKQQSKEEREALKEKKLLKLVGAVVVKCMSKHQKTLDHDTFKKHARELTQVIAEKEKKSNSYQTGKLDALSDEKVAKIKKFSKEYIAKLLRRLDKQHKRSDASGGASGSRSHGSSSHRHGASSSDPRLQIRNKLANGHGHSHSSRHEQNDSRGEGSSATPVSNSPSGSVSTPRGARERDEDADAEGGYGAQSVEDTVNDIFDDGDDADADMEADASGDPSPATDTLSTPRAVSVAVVGQDMELDDDGLPRGVGLGVDVSAASGGGGETPRGTKPSRWDQGPEARGVSLSPMTARGAAEVSTRGQRFSG